MGSMSLDDIANGSLCVLDTNVLLYAEQGVSQQAQRLLRRCSIGEVVGILPQTVWQELIHKLVLAEAAMLGKLSGLNLGRKLARKPEIVKELRLYREKALALADLGLGFEPCTKEDLLEAGLRFQEKYGLLTNDSVILATAVRLKADVLASADIAFQMVTELDVAMPSDTTL
jgi:predicted nucleic acid-binding protein